MAGIAAETGASQKAAAILNNSAVTITGLR
jgi:hypothetical protein